VGPAPTDCGRPLGDFLERLAGPVPGYRVATQNAWLVRGLVPEVKAVRVANYIKTLRRDLVNVAEACGVEHPGLITTESVDILDGWTASMPLHEVYGYQPGIGLHRRPTAWRSCG
jgi:hypothetical protein